MHHLARTWASAAADKFETATISDFGHLMLAVVVLGWFLARSDRQ